jgi:hypothetical protein
LKTFFSLVCYAPLFDNMSLAIRTIALVYDFIC